jgi:hypothetical protein
MKDWPPEMVSEPIQESLLKLIADKKNALTPTKEKTTKSTKDDDGEKSNDVNIMDALKKSVETELKSRRAGRGDREFSHTAAARRKSAPGYPQPDPLASPSRQSDRPLSARSSGQHCKPFQPMTGAAAVALWQNAIWRQVERSADLFRMTADGPGFPYRA